MSDLFQAAGLEPAAPSPLADRLRPQRLEDVVGQDHLLGPEGPIRRMVENGRLSSMILWGPPGTGKTTIARLLAKAGGYEFQQLSAVFSGVADLKKAFETARTRRLAGQSTLSVRGRDPPLQPRAAGRLSAVRRVGDGDPRRGHHREPVVRTERGVAVALSGLRTETPR